MMGKEPRKGVFRRCFSWFHDVRRIFSPFSSDTYRTPTPKSGHVVAFRHTAKVTQSNTGEKSSPGSYLFRAA